MTRILWLAATLYALSLPLLLLGATAQESGEQTGETDASDPFGSGAVTPSPTPTPVVPAEAADASTRAGDVTGAPVVETTIPTTERDSDVIDSRITFVFADDNVFAGASDFSPSADIGQRSKINTFFDAYDSKDSGQETKTNFVFYRRMGGSNPRIETEAGLVARLDFFTDEETGRPGSKLGDDGTFLQASYLLGDVQAERTELPGSRPRVYMLAFPFNADRMRLGYSFDITWGGNDVFPKNTAGAPGLKIGAEGERGYVFAGIKTHRQLNEATNDLDAVYGYLAGLGLDFGEAIRWELGGGVFQKGVFPPIGSDDPVGGAHVQGQGVSTQLTYHHGLPIETSVDLRLYRNDPRFPWRSFRKETFAQDWAYLVSTEFTYLGQNLRDADVFGQTEIQNGMAGDVNLRLKKGYLRFTGDFVYRNLPFILFNVPSFTPYYGFPDSAETTPEWFVAGGVDYYIEKWRLNPGIILGYQTPSTYAGDAAALGLADEGISTVVVRREGDFDILPPGQAAFDIISARAFSKLELSDAMSFIGEVTYTLDKNATRLVSTDDGFVVRRFDDPNVSNRLALAFIVQARF